MMMTNVTLLQAAMGVGILLTPFLIIILTIFALLFNLLHRIFTRRIGKRLGDLDSIDKSIIWMISMVASLAIIAAMLYAVYELFLSRIVFL